MLPIYLAGTIIWGLWLYRVALSRRYKPVRNDFSTSVSVVVPSYREDPAILESCLQTWLAQEPTEILIVVDVADLECQKILARQADPRVKSIVFQHSGKRSALGVGIRAAVGELIVLVDSDTRWLPDLLKNIQMPFDDPAVGAVSTRQNVYQRGSSLWRRVADWLVNLRYSDYVPAMGRSGAVICVSGRTAAYRASVVLPVLAKLEDEFFLGRRCISGDDGRLTWLVLGAGYRTVFQENARALSMFPNTLTAFAKQRVRWSRNSYRCYLTALWKGWFWHVPFVSKVTLLQILLTPLTMGVTLGYLVFNRFSLTWQGWSLVIGWIFVGRAIRGFSHLRRHPRDLAILPVMVVVVILIALPIKLYAFVTMNKQGWLTRSAHQIGGQGQSAVTLTRAA